MLKLLAILAAIVLFVFVALGLAITIVPRFLDRIYYRGPASDHFDGERFHNPPPDTAQQFGPPGGGGRARFIWNQITGRDGRPVWPKSVPVAQSKPPPRVEGDRLLVTWIGHATVLIQTQGLNILTDPIWSERTGPFGRGPRRAAEPSVAFDDLPPIDIVLVSHNHYDHLDQPTLARLVARDRPRIVTPLGNDAVIALPGTEAIDWGQSVAAKNGVSIVAVRAHHWGTRFSTDRNRALWGGFVVKLPSGGNVYFAGDTGFGDGKLFAEAAAHGPIRLALLPIGAFRFVPGQMAINAHMGPPQAVEAFRRTGAARAIPIHWGTFRLSYEAYDTPTKLLEAAMACTGQHGFDPVAIGAPTEVAPYVAPATVAEMPAAALARCLDTDAVRAMR